MNQLLSFYLGKKNTEGRYLHDIISWPDKDMEKVHDYIQWIFPNIEKSHFNLNAPVLDNKTIETWKKSPHLKKLLLLSTKRYISFLNNNFNIWAVPIDHNHLRITRMLKSLVILGLKDEAEEILLWLNDVADNSNIDVHSLECWKEALNTNLQ